MTWQVRKMKSERKTGRWGVWEVNFIILVYRACSINQLLFSITFARHFSAKTIWTQHSANLFQTASRLLDLYWNLKWVTLNISDRSSLSPILIWKHLLSYLSPKAAVVPLVKMISKPMCTNCQQACVRFCWETSKYLDAQPLCGSCFSFSSFPFEGSEKNLSNLVDITFYIHRPIIIYRPIIMWSLVSRK